ncbi:MAG: glycosyltransferase family 4 protein, partial [Bacteroidota bacterium]
MGEQEKTRPVKEVYERIAVVANSAWNLLNFRGGLIKALVAAGHQVVLLAPEGPERPSLEAMGAEFIPLRHLRRKGMNPLRELRLLREFYRIFHRENVTVSLLFTIKPVIYGSLAARLARARNISTLTGLGFTFISTSTTSFIVRALYRMALRKADTVFFHNPDDLKHFVESGLVRKAQAAVVPGSGIALAKYPLAPYSEAIPGRFLFIGRLLVDKGLREFVAAARFAKKENPSLSFHVLGPFDADNPAGITPLEFDRWVEEGTIVYEGVTDDVRPHLRRAAVVVLPSYREGCPRALLEAAATGRALIGTDVPGVREVVVPGENGWLVPVRDGEALGRCFLRLGDVESLVGMARAGRRRVNAEFSLKIVVKSYLQ